MHSRVSEAVGFGLDSPVISITHGAGDCLTEPVRMEELQNIWQHVVGKRGSYSLKESNVGDMDTLVGSSDSSSKKRKGQIVSSDFADDVSSLKKARLYWSVQLHQQFVNAVNQLGINKAVPKKILDVMNVQGLTRENVASHLQKYRLHLKRLSGVIPEPCPVASFRASEDGHDGGYMQVRPGGAGSEALKPLRYGKANQRKQAANRAQVLGRLGSANVKKQKADQISASSPLPCTERMSYLDLGILLKAPVEVPPRLEASRGFDDDDLSPQAFRGTMMLESIGTAGPFGNDRMVEMLVHPHECSRSDFEVGGMDGKKIAGFEESRSSAHLLPLPCFNYAASDDRGESYREDSSPPSATYSSSKTDHNVASTSSDFYSASQLDVSDYTVDEIYLVSELKSREDGGGRACF